MVISIHEKYKSLLRSKAIALLQRGNWLVTLILSMLSVDVSCIYTVRRRM